jgi:hypothetical protein
MRRSSSKSAVVLPPVTRGLDACQMLTRAQLGQDPSQRTVLGVLTENGQYRRTCGQVITQNGSPVMGGCEGDLTTSTLPFSILPLPS